MASSRASTAGWRKSQSSTSAPTLMVVLTAAADAMAAMGPRPSSKWSGTRIVEYPSASASRTVSAQVDPGSGASSWVANRNVEVMVGNANGDLSTERAVAPP